MKIFGMAAAALAAFPAYAAPALMPLPVSVVPTGTDTLRNVRMFGTVIERDSRFKFIGHSNSL